MLWQKERLLNIAMRHLPGNCDAVAWLDCDVIFPDQGWPERARAALDSFAMVQLFSESCQLGQGARNDPCGWAPVERVTPGMVHGIWSGELTPDDRRPSKFTSRGSKHGMAWAAPRALLDQHGFYDARIAGGGDRAMLCAAWGQFDYCVDAHAMKGRSIEHYRAWGDRFYGDLRGRIGNLEGHIFHLWHGQMARRLYRERHQQLAKFDFDPFTDIALNANGCWRWNSDKPELHDYMKNYFASRNEDGLATATPEDRARV